MAPFASKASCCEGALNEPFIFAHLPSSFVNQRSVSDERKTFIESLHEFGLLCNKDNIKNAAFSPDGIAWAVDVLADDTEESRILALVEMKSKCSNATLLAEKELVTLYEDYLEIYVDMDPERFKALIPEATYRCQLLHGMASKELDDALYVVASLSCIIRVVRVKISLMICMQYLSAIAQVGRDHLGCWLDSGIVPQIELPEVSHAVDQHTLQFTFDVWNAFLS